MRQIGDAYVANNAIVTGDVVLSAGANIWFGCVLRGDLSRITLGPRANLQDGCIVHTDHDAPQTIEEGVVVGHRATLHGTLIGRDTLVGMGAILLSGCEIGAECLIAAGTLITEKRRIPPRSVVMGVPGKVVREVTDEDLRRVMEISAHYLEMAQRYARRGIPAALAGGAVVNETLIRPTTDASSFSVDLGSDRRADVDSKQSKIAALLRETGREGLLLLEPENVAWIGSGGQARGVLDPLTGPAVYCTGDGRWVICSNIDSQRVFEEDFDGLGFQLKEWPWHWGREQFLADLCHNRKILCDRSPGVDGDSQVIDPALRKLRRSLSAYEQACLLALGQTLAHALEATCRTLAHKESEREVAGQLSHRLIHRGVHPIHVGVSANGRSREFRRYGYTPTLIDRYAVLTATGRKYGLCATASRTVCFGAPPDDLKSAHSAVCRVSASYLASTWPDAVPREILMAGRRIYVISEFEHEWLLSPQGHLTGRVPIEYQFTQQSTDLLEPGLAITWNASAGPAVSSDTFLVTDQGPKPITPAELWPLKRIRIQGAECIRPDILVR